VLCVPLILSLPQHAGPRRQASFLDAIPLSCLTACIAKIVVLGAQGVGKTSLLQRFIHNNFKEVQHPTIGANFLTKKIVIPEYPHITLRLQIWDTAGQERFRSISKLYYRGANAALLCYDITSASSFDQMGTWLQELRQHNIITNSTPTPSIDSAEEAIIHVVGTKADVVAENPHNRQVTFERCISYVAEHLQGGVKPPANSHTTSPVTPISTTVTHPSSSYPSSYAASRRKDSHYTTTSSAGAQTPTSPGGASNSDRQSGLWGQDTGWDCCHEISSKDGEGVEEVFRVIAKKLIEQQLDVERRNELAREVRMDQDALGIERAAGYFDGYGTQGSGMDRGGSFRLGYGDKRRSWLGLGATPVVSVPGSSYGEAAFNDGQYVKQGSGGRCC